MATIIIDLTPVLPGGENGGAKVVVLQLIKQLGKIAPKDNFILFTSEGAHEELSHLDAPNIRRMCVRKESSISIPVNVSVWTRGLNLIKRIISGIRIRSTQHSLQEELKPDLLFCPFTAPLFSFSKVPIISVIHDLQFLAYPHFFTVEDQAQRNAHFQKACDTASRLICVSEFTRQDVLKNSSIEPERVVAIGNYLSDEWAQKGANAGIPELLKQYELEYEDFLLYPANFWKHKNHKMLLTAFGMYRNKHPHSSLKLVCTGSPGPRLDEMKTVVKIMNLERHVIFPGYISSEALFNLLFSSKALIFPSLYEGFGIPVVEAMLVGKVVLCSNQASLPEVGGDAAVYFHPGKPKEILSAIEKLEQDFAALSPQIVRGYQKALDYLGTDKMAKAYYQVFQAAMKDTNHYQNILHGVFEDGWTREKISLDYMPSDKSRILNMTLHCPISHPKAPLNVVLVDSHSSQKVDYLIKADETIIIKHSLPKESGSLELLIENAFQPAQHGMGEDVRQLGCVFLGYNIGAEEQEMSSVQ